MINPGDRATFRLDNHVKQHRYRSLCTGPSLSGEGPQNFWKRHFRSVELIPVKSLREELWFEIPNRRGFLNITPQVEDLVKKSGVKDGLCLVNAMHITPCVDFSLSLKNYCK